MQGEETGVHEELGQISHANKRKTTLAIEIQENKIRHGHNLEQKQF